MTFAMFRGVFTGKSPALSVRWSGHRRVLKIHGTSPVIEFIILPPAVSDYLRVIVIKYDPD